MAYSVKKLNKEDWPPLLGEIPDGPKELYYAGQIPDYDRKFLCVVGSRKYTSYGKEACEYLIQGLRGYPVTIVSGLALGIDSIAHRAALRNNLPTIGIPGSGLNQKALHPQAHVRLAEEIVESGGALISEFEPNMKSTLWSFPQRNRIMAAMSHAILIIEAEIKSGTLITGKYASGYNRELLAVPGNITSSTSEGPNMLIRIGATPIRNPEDILEALGITPSGLTDHLPLSKGEKKREYSDCSPEELKIISILETPVEKDELIRMSGLGTSQMQSLLTLLELKGHIKESLGEIRLT